MQLKLTETTSGLSDKDIKTMTKLVYTVPCDFKDLADICQVTVGVHKLIFGAASPLAEMLSDWVVPLYHRSVRERRKHGGPSDKHGNRGPNGLPPGMVHREEETAVPTQLPDRQQRRRGRLVQGVGLPPRTPEYQGQQFSLQSMRVLLVGQTPRRRRKADEKHTAAANRTPTPAKTAAGGKQKGKDGRNPQAVVYDRDPNDRWQTFIDHAKSGPIPNMCCSYHLNGICTDLCFIRSLHADMTRNSGNGGPTAGVGWDAQERRRAQTKNQNKGRVPKKDDTCFPHKLASPSLSFS